MEFNHNLNEPNLKSINFRPPVVPLSILYIHSTHEATCSKISGNLRFQFFNVYCSLYMHYLLFINMLVQEVQTRYQALEIGPSHPGIPYQPEESETFVAMLGGRIRNYFF